MVQSAMGYGYMYISNVRGVADCISCLPEWISYLKIEMCSESSQALKIRLFEKWEHWSRLGYVL